MDASTAIPHGEHGPRLARRWLERVLPGAAAEAALPELLLLATELVGNAVVHGRPRPDGTVGLRLRADRTTVRLEAEDAGSGRPRARRRARGATGGRGLRIVAHLADRWGVRAGARTVVWAEVDLAGNPGAQGLGGRSLSEPFASSLKRTAARAKAAHRTKTVITAPAANRIPELTAR